MSVQELVQRWKGRRGPTRNPSTLGHYRKALNASWQSRLWSTLGGSARLWNLSATSFARASGRGITFDHPERTLEAHGGMIGVTSKVGAGTTFTVSLPTERTHERSM